MQTVRDFFELLPFNDEDAQSFPFFEEIELNDDINNMVKKMQEIQEWLMENVGDPPRWCIGEMNSGVVVHTFQFLFKHPEDVVAFKLKWL